MGDKYIVNPGGLVMSVTEEHFAELIDSKPNFEGKAYREATDEEAADCAAREAGASAGGDESKGDDDAKSKGKSPKGDK